jgi:hypothetical protein
LEILSVFLSKSTSDTPDCGKNEDVFETLDFIMVEDVLEKFAN